MKIVLILAIVFLGAGLWYALPIYNQTTICYANGLKTLDEIEFRTRAAGWDKRKICEGKFDVVTTLAQCLQNVNEKGSKAVMKYIGPYIDKIFYSVHPFIKKYPQQKTDYNTDCRDFPDIIIE